MHFAKDKLCQNMSKFQIACKPWHRPSEHLYTIKSVIAYYMSKREGLIMSSYDIMKMFDSKNLYDCMNEVYNCSVKGKVYRLIYEMNKNIRIKVKTSVGLTPSEDTGPVLGTVEAGIISSVSLGNGVDVTFADSDCEV